MTLALKSLDYPSSVAEQDKGILRFMHRVKVILIVSVL